MVDSVQDRLRIGVAEIESRAALFDHRQGYFDGDQRLPYAPPGVSVEYLELRRQALANWIRPALNAPVQRMDAESLSFADTGKTDPDVWQHVWVTNDLETRQRIVYESMMTHGRGVLSVSKAGAGAKVSVESARRVYLHPSPEDPFTPAFAVKMWTETARPASALWVPSAVDVTGAKTIAVLYTDTTCHRFERSGHAGPGAWELVRETDHGLGDIPFVQFGHQVDADNVPRSPVDDLEALQDAINTIRFNTLLAMQFSAYRQRVVVGYDPVMRDAAGEVVYVRDEGGEVVIGPDGQPVPQLRQAGRASVDRMLVFPGADTKVFDLAESNLDRYISVYKAFLTDLFSKAQVPPQYALDRMANLSGDALSGAESTLTSLVAELKREVVSGMRKVLRLTDVARGQEPRNRTIDWADTEPRSFAQTVDGVVKLVSAGFPRKAAFDMLPGATPAKLENWMQMQQDEAADAFGARMLEQFTTDLSGDDVSGGIGRAGR